MLPGAGAVIDGGDDVAVMPGPGPGPPELLGGGTLPNGPSAPPVLLGG